MKTYRKIPIISTGRIFVQKAYFQRSLFSEGLIIGRNFAFQNGLDLTIKTAENTTKKSLKQLKTASTNSSWAYIRVGLSSKVLLRLRFGGGGAYFRAGVYFF